MAVAAAERAAPSGRGWALAFAVAALAIAVFLPIRHHDWVNYDDPVYVTGSPPVVEGLSAASLRWAFTSFDGANWFPLTRLSWMLDAELHGLSAGAFLTTNLLLHALASGVLCLALAVLTGNALRSAFVAAVFAVHPLHVESVAWIAARKDPLSGLFFALALLVYGVGRERGGPAWSRPAVFACMGLGLMAKPTVVTLPAVLLLLDHWPLRRFERPDGTGFDGRALRSAVVEKWPLLALAAVFGGITVLAQQSGGTLASLEQLDLADRLANAVRSYGLYLVKSFWPTGLAVFYPHTVPSVDAVAVSGALLVALSLAAWQQRGRRPYLAVGWLWFLVTLLPVIGIVQVGSQAMADRYTYLPLIGLALAVGWGAADLASRLRGGRAGAAVAGLATVAALAVTAAGQVRHWRDSETLFRHALAVTQENHVAHAYLGTALLAQGRTGLAIESYEAALRIRPDHLTVLNNLAWLLATTPDPRHRDPARAVLHAERAARRAPDDPAVLDTLGAAYAASGRFDAATATLDRAIAIAERRGDGALAAELRQRRSLYRARRAFVGPPLP